jgi:hypothetical protein
VGALKQDREVIMPTALEDWLVVGTIILLVLAYCAFEYQLKQYFLTERYDGFGWVLRWEEGNVIIVTHLLNSPSHRAEVIIGSTLLSMNGVALKFKTGELWDTFIQSYRRPALGETFVFSIKYKRAVRLISMVAEVIEGPIPVYKPWPLTEDHSIYTYPVCCERTGVWYAKSRLRDSAVDQVLARSWN